MGIIFVTKGCKIQRKGKMSPLLKLETFLATNTFTTNQILYNTFFWKTWCYMLQNVIDLYFLLNIHG
jgi:hypothetical protein